MIVAIHAADTCALSNPTSRDLVQQQMGHQDQVAAARSIAIQGAWVNAPSHTTFMLVDAPNAHAVNDFVREIQFMAWNTVIVHPVVSMAEAAAQALANPERSPAPH